MVNIDPAVVAQASRDLIRHGLDIGDASQIPYPDTGTSAATGADVVDLVVSQAEELTETLGNISWNIDYFLSLWTATENGVAGAFREYLFGRLT